jgi:hypothetical protein
MAEARTTAAINQRCALVLQVDQVVGIAAGVVEQRNFGQTRSR